MRIFAARYPVVFASLLALALFSLALASRAALPTHVTPSVENLPADLATPPTQGEEALNTLKTSENLYGLVSALLAVILLTRLCWWREAGFDRPSRNGNPVLLLFPFFVGALSLLGGVSIRGPALFASSLLSILIVVFAEEALYRGIFWRALAPKGAGRATVATSLLSSALFLAGSDPEAPWPETVYLLVLTFCAGFAYAVLRWRTGSVWPPMVLHFMLAFSAGFSTPETVPYLSPLLVLASTLGFLGYGLLLLYRPHTPSDDA